jgi:fucose 4-O-acetylase-like acetyltransferase
MPHTDEKMAKPTHRRLPWIDAVKGCGITLVVLGHVANDSLVHSLIYVFHMPLFFFISGFLHKPQSNFIGYAKKKAIHLLVPYVCFAVLTSLLEAIRLRHNFTPAEIRHGLLIVTWGGSKMSGLYGVLWFLTCLFLTQQLMNWLMVKVGPIALTTLTCLALALSYANSVLFPSFSLPLDANVVLAAMPFFLAGYFFRDVEFSNWKWLLPGLIGFSLSIWLLIRQAPLSYDMRAGTYGVPIVSFVLALCCILGVIYICRAVENMPLFARSLHRLGAVSMSIMFIHKELPGLPRYTLLERQGVTVTFVIVLLISYYLAVLLARVSSTRALFLGSERDFQVIVKHRGLIAKIRSTVREQSKHT